MEKSGHKKTIKKRVITEQSMIKAIEESYGIITLIAKRLKIHRSAVYNNIKKYGLNELIELERERLVDFAESKLIENIKKGKETSIIFALKTIGKKRGYVERQEIQATIDPIKEKVLSMTEEERKARIEELKKKLISETNKERKENESK